MVARLFHDVRVLFDIVPFWNDVDDWFGLEEAGSGVHPPDGADGCQGGADELALELGAAALLVGAKALTSPPTQAQKLISLMGQ